MRVQAFVILTVATVFVTACTSADNQRVNERSRLTNDLTGRLTHAASLTYTATYTLPGGASATVAQAQQPLRVAITYPGGKVALTPTNVLVCRSAKGASPAPAASPGAGMRCSLATAPSSVGDALTTALTLAGNLGLVTPAAIVGLLSTAAIDLNAVIDQRDTTIAGENATCVDVKGLQNAAAAVFDACITAGGILGSFEGTVSGSAVKVLLDQYDEQVAADAFEPPAGATISY